MTRPMKTETLAVTTAVLALMLTSCGPSAPPAAAAPSAPPAPAPGSLAGTIELAPGVDVTLDSYDCIFLMGRRDPDSRVPELVRVLRPARLPTPFQLTARDLLGVGTLTGEWHLSARLDSDGDAVAQKGDVEGSTPRPVTAETRDLRIVLDHVRTESAPVPMIDPTAGHGIVADALGHRLPHGADGQLPTGHPPLDTTVTAHGAPAASSEDSEDGEPRIRGTVELSDEFADRNGTATLYLSIKAGTAARGMPRAVQRVTAPRFPLAFDIGPEHVPLAIENKADLLQGDGLFVIARLDTDGDALSKHPDDLEATPVPVVAGGPPVTVTIDGRRDP